MSVYTDIVNFDVHSIVYQNYLVVYNTRYKKSVQEVESTFNWSIKIMMLIFENYIEEYISDKELLEDLVECINIIAKLMMMSTNNLHQKFLDTFIVITNLNKILISQNRPFKIQVLDFNESEIADCDFYKLTELDDDSS